MIRLHLFSEIEPLESNRNFFRPLLELILKMSNTDLEQANISLILTDDQNIQEFNNKYRQQNKPTDVLSFLYSPSQDHSRIDGEIFISVQKAHDQSQKYEQTFCSEMAQLFTHGVIHLLGLDHEIPDQEESFLNLQERVLTRFNKTKASNTICVQNSI